MFCFILFYSIHYILNVSSFSSHQHGVSSSRTYLLDKILIVYIWKKTHKKNYCTTQGLQKLRLNCRKIDCMWWLMYNLTRKGQPMYFPSTIKPQLVTKWETCDYYWTFLISFGHTWCGWIFLFYLCANTKTITAKRTTRVLVGALVK